MFCRGWRGGFSQFAAFAKLIFSEAADQSAGRLQHNLQLAIAW
jgi:hypothetical protein